jgi:hypothetical protein
MRFKKRYFLLGLVLAFACEQLFLDYYVGPLVERQDEAFDQVIAGLGPPEFPYDPNDWNSLAYNCLTKRILIVYTYDVCILYSPPDPSGKQGFFLEVIRPAAYLSLIGWNDPDRKVRNRRHILSFDKDHNHIIKNPNLK